MGSNDTQAALSRAHGLVEAGDLDEARAIVEPILAADPDNADAWWIYAHSVTSPEEGRMALDNVLRLNPNYPGAAELLELADKEAPPRPKITPISHPASVPEAPSRPETFPEPESEAAASAAPSSAPPPSRGGLPVLPMVAVVVIVILVVLVLLSSVGGGTATPTETPTALAAVIVTGTEESAATTEAPTVTALPIETTPEITATEAVIPTPMPTEAPTLEAAPATAEVSAEAPVEVTAVSSEAATADFTAVSSALSQFSVAENGIAEEQTSYGNTLIVSVCTAPGRAARTVLVQVMNAYGKASASLDSSVAAIGVRTVDCEQNAPLQTVAVDLATAQSYAQGGLGDVEFDAKWTAQ